MGFNVFAPLIAGYVHTWPERLAVLLLIALLAYYSVYLRARRARRDGKPFPHGSLVLCTCLFVGFAAGVADGFKFAGSVAFGLISGVIGGGLIGMPFPPVHAKKGREPASPGGVYDREIDR